MCNMFDHILENVLHYCFFFITFKHLQQLNTDKEVDKQMGLSIHNPSLQFIIRNIYSNKWYW